MEIADREAGTRVGLREGRETAIVYMRCTLAGGKEVLGVRLNMGDLCVCEGKEG
jgi:hypothetical protein